MLEVYATAGKFAGQWVVVNSTQEAINEFGMDIDRGTFRPYQPQTVEFVTVGCDVVQVMDDGSEKLVATAPNQDEAEKLAYNLNHK